MQALKVGTLCGLANYGGCKVDGVVLWVVEGEGGCQCFLGCGDAVLLVGVEVQGGVLGHSLTWVVGRLWLGLSVMLVGC